MLEPWTPEQTRDYVRGCLRETLTAVPKRGKSVHLYQDEAKVLLGALRAVQAIEDEIVELEIDIVLGGEQAWAEAEGEKKAKIATDLDERAARIKHLRGLLELDGSSAG